jgi:hypothetical protein
MRVALPRLLLSRARHGCFVAHRVLNGIVWEGGAVICLHDPPIFLSQPVVIPLAPIITTRAPIRTVEAFWRYVNNLILPTELDLNANYRFFKEGR